MNGYNLTRDWFAFTAENSTIVECKHTAMYLYIIEVFNKRQWVEVTGLPTDFTMGILNIKSYKTYKKVFEDLISFGFIKLIEKSMNQFTSNKIALVKKAKASSNAIEKHIPNQVESNDQSDCSIYKHTKQLNNITNKQINSAINFLDMHETKQIDFILSDMKLKYAISESEISFETFWNLYDNKKGLKDAKLKWNSLPSSIQEKIIETLPKFKSTISEKKYMPLPSTYFNQRRWEDEIEETTSNKKDYILKF